jgi:hypothetical protein
MASEDRNEEMVMRTPRPNPIGVTPSASSRALSGVELIVATLIVLGHNVFRVLPNEVPILVVIGLVSKLDFGYIDKDRFRPKAVFG